MRIVGAALVALLLMLSGRPAVAAAVTIGVPQADGSSLALAGELARPAGEGPFPAVVMLHGCAGMSKLWGGAWARRLTDWGYVALQVDSFAGRGYPDGVCGNGVLVPAWVRAGDAHAAKAFLAALPDVDGDRIAVLGMSHGGWSTLWAVKDTPLAARLTGAPFRAAVALYPYCDGSLSRLASPLLVLIGDADDWTPARLCERERLAGDSDFEMALKVYPGATHGFDLEGLDVVRFGHRLTHDPAATADAAARVRDFLATHLKAD